MPISTSDLLTALRARANAEGLAPPRVTAARLPPEIGERLTQFVEAGLHGDMDWLAETQGRRQSPEVVWPQARSAVVFALPYTPDLEPLVRLQDKTSAVISVYALNRDYHELFKGKLKRLGQWFAHASKNKVKVFVDTAPFLEKPLAAQAGLGWQGKHTNLVSRELGSWFFLGVMLTDRALPFEEAEQDHCGTCRSCLDICPTNAFPAPYQLDATRCISYLTIEHKGHIAPEFRKAMGNRIFGCDDCLAVCPWNKFAVVAHEAKLKAREDLVSPSLYGLLALEDGQFRKLFSGSPVKRIGRERFLRNCLIAAGNSGDAALVAPAMNLLDDRSPLVRAMAVWALRQLQDGAEFSALRSTRGPVEPDDNVRREWQGQVQS